MLKSVLALLLSKFVKRSDTEFICNQVFPDGWNRRVLIKAAKGTFEGTYRAPVDGYLCMDGGNGLRSLSLRGSVHLSIVQSGDANMAWPQSFIPLRKGTTGEFGVTAISDQLDPTNVYFVPAMGTPSF